MLQDVENGTATRKVSRQLSCVLQGMIFFISLVTPLASIFYGLDDDSWHYGIGMSVIILCFSGVTLKAIEGRVNVHIIFWALATFGVSAIGFLVTVTHKAVSSWVYSLILLFPLCSALLLCFATHRGRLATCQSSRTTSRTCCSRCHHVSGSDVEQRRSDSGGKILEQEYCRSVSYLF